MHLDEIAPARILVADDEEASRNLLATILERNGYDVLLATDGLEAAELFATEHVDLALLDVKMPRRTGLELCRMIKSDPKTRLVPVVLITGLSSSIDHVQGIECGADDYLRKPVRSQEMTARVRSLLNLKHFTDELGSAEAVLFSLALSIEARNPYTEGHCARLSKYSIDLANVLGLPEEQLLALRRAGLVHDIGKVAVPDRILLKPGLLTFEETKVIQQHPIVGERICQPLQSFRSVLPIIRHHHEKMDGSGYPDGLVGEAIPLTARILTTVDVYDSLTTDRPYRLAMSPSEAFMTLREEVRRGWRDGRLVEEFEPLMMRRNADPI
ncbi:MAG: HD domain-containing phosphohydrolase [Acidobacteriaceae bacterium]|jgi:putative two-component system response regulator